MRYAFVLSTESIQISRLAVIKPSQQNNCLKPSFYTYANLSTYCPNATVLPIKANILFNVGVYAFGNGAGKCGALQNFFLFVVNF